MTGARLLPLVGPAPDEPPPPPVDCHSNAGGHNLHWIQTSKAHADRDPATRIGPGWIVSVAEDGWLEVRDTAGVVHRRWNHAPHRIAAAIRAVGNYPYEDGAPVSVSLRWGYLALGSGGTYCLGHEPHPCQGPMTWD